MMLISAGFTWYHLVTHQRGETAGYSGNMKAEGAFPAPAIVPHSQWSSGPPPVASTGCAIWWGIGAAIDMLSIVGGHSV